MKQSSGMPLVHRLGRRQEATTEAALRRVEERHEDVETQRLAGAECLAATEGNHRPPVAPDTTAGVCARAGVGWAFPCRAPAARSTISFWRVQQLVAARPLLGRGGVVRRGAAGALVRPPGRMAGRVFLPH